MTDMEHPHIIRMIASFTSHDFGTDPNIINRETKRESDGFNSATLYQINATSQVKSTSGRWNDDSS